MNLTANCDLFLYADDSCSVYHHNDVKAIERNLKNNCSNICDGFVDKLSIHFREDKIKCILFGINHRLN